MWLDFLDTAIYIFVIYAQFTMIRSFGKLMDHWGKQE